MFSLQRCALLWKGRWRAVSIVREDNITLLRAFLAGKGPLAKGCNVLFNAACKAVRLLRPLSRDEREQKPLPAPAPFCAVIAETSIPQCLHYRVEERVAQLEHLGWQAAFCDWRDFFASRQLMELASCVLFYRVPMIGHVEALFTEARRLGLSVIFDIDDLIFDRNLYAATLAKKALPPDEVKGLLDLADMYRSAMDSADVLLTSTAVLAGCLPKKGAAVHNSLSGRMLQLAAARGERQSGEDIVRMFYGSGSPTHDEDFALVADAVADALHEDERLQLTIFGHLALPPALEACERVFRMDFLEKDIYYQTIASYDIALMPLVDSLFNDAKSNIKYQEASLFGIPSIVSPRADFLEVVRDGENGLIARSPGEWKNAILKLAASPELRILMGSNARATVLERYGCAAVAERELRPQLPVVSPGSGNPRVLLVNVLFGEISFGGATMVVEDTARELTHMDFDVHAFCAGRAEGFFPTEMKRYDWNGVSVVMVCDMPEEREARERTALLTFRRVLDRVQPHVVHFHCIQDFGLDILRECRCRGIPYVVTMHDAWWICPRQFMLDPEGLYCARRRAFPEVCAARCGLDGADVCRRQCEMGEALAGAARILVPSCFFADMMRRNFPACAAKFHVNRNGVRRPSAPRPAGKDGPLRLGFLGGKAAHKGYFFLAKALRALERTDFELLLVDVHTVFGSGLLHSREDAELWQGLPVRIIPFVPHEAIDALYADLDVLLFPSLGEESFGLTVREAIIRDVFVIASECGGPCEAIVPGENGLLFPPGDLEAFCRHLHFVLDNRERFVAYRTSNFGDIVDGQTQAQELAAIYRALALPAETI